MKLFSMQCSIWWNQFLFAVWSELAVLHNSSHLFPTAKLFALPSKSEISQIFVQRGLLKRFDQPMHAVAHSGTRNSHLARGLGNTARVEKLAAKASLLGWQGCQQTVNVVRQTDLLKLAARPNVAVSQSVLGCQNLGKTGRGFRASVERTNGLSWPTPARLSPFDQSRRLTFHNGFDESLQRSASWVVFRKSSPELQLQILFDVLKIRAAEFRTLHELPRFEPYEPRCKSIRQWV